MEIHSSSLNGIQPAYHTKNTDKDRLASNKENKESTENTDRLLLADIDHVNKIYDINELEQLTETIEKQKKILTNSVAGRALKAYSQENVQHLKNQRSELISRIDFFT